MHTMKGNPMTEDNHPEFDPAPGPQKSFLESQLDENKPVISKSWISNLSTILKLMMIGFQILLLLIPMGMVQGVIGEREQNQRSANADIARAWGGNQVLFGPMLNVPYKKNKETRYIHIMPSRLSVDVDIKPEVRARGIFKSVVYTSALTVKGSLNPAEAGKMAGIDPKSLDWAHSTVTMSLSDMRGMMEPPVALVDGKKLGFEPMGQVSGVSGSGLQVPLALSAGKQEIPFAFDLNLRGSETLQLVPAGADTEVKMASPWQHPSFIGQFLPVSRTVSEKGFTATWNVNRFARSFPQAWTDAYPGFEAMGPLTTRAAAYQTESTTDYTVYTGMDTTSQQKINVLGVSLLQPVNAYRESTRSAKYAILFLSLTFLTYFLMEIILKARIHAFQYLLVGLALCLFYLLLVSISEFSSFLNAYLIASAATVALITAYTSAIVRTRRTAMTLGMGGLLTALYIYLYVLLQLEDMSLLFGSVGLFVILAAVMFVTRRIDWYGER